jgi:hypothetical protein
MENKILGVFLVICGILGIMAGSVAVVEGYSVDGLFILVFSVIVLIPGIFLLVVKKKMPKRKPRF